jgi:DNA modification methylase
MLSARVVLGDCKEVLKSLESDSFDSMVTDPPAGIAFMGKAWDSYESLTHFQADMTEVFKEALRVLKPGAHGLVWALPRTSPYTGLALANAGFEIRDMVLHLFGTGMPKGQNVAKAGADAWEGWNTTLKPAHEIWWLVRKPIVEKTVVAQVLATGTGAINVDACRVGAGHDKGGLACFERSALNSAVDGSFRKAVETDSTVGRWPANVVLSHAPECELRGSKRVKGSNAPGRGSKGEGERGIGFGEIPGKPGPMPFYTDPENYGMETVDDWNCVDGCPVAALDEQSGECGGGSLISTRPPSNGFEGKALKINERTTFGYKDKGGASRFFYITKATPSERQLPDGTTNAHPTLKTVKLMRYFVKLVTPLGGTVLDPFAGSGTTGVAALQESLNFVGIELDPEHHRVAQLRLDTEQAEAVQRSILDFALSDEA